jgi:predicted nucleic acid-binding protein
MLDNKIIFDTNAILRYILDDVPEQADIVEKIIAERENTTTLSEKRLLKT